jgi:hypothetical protein
MPTDRTPPHDLEAEAAVLGAMLLARDARVTIADEALTAADFYKPAHGALFQTMSDLATAGVPVDAVTVADHLGRAGLLDELGGAGALLAIQAGTPSISNVARYARIVMRHAAGRRLLVAAADATQAVYDHQDPGEVAQRAVAALDAIDAPSDAPPQGLSLLADIAAADVEQTQPWVCDGLFREQWRAVAVGPEGFGKSVLSTQLAMCIAAGVHPLSFERITPAPTLMLILENRQDTVAHHHKLVERALGKWASGPRLSWALHKPQGMNLRNARHRAELVEVLHRVRPALVVISPIYKLFRVEPGENYEQATAAVQSILDELIARHHFALFCEHHAGKGNGSERNLDPSGSALWLRWPEFGFKLKPDSSNPKAFTRLTLDRYRGDRIPADWPQEITKGRDWPWEGTWENGHFRP